MRLPVRLFARQDAALALDRFEHHGTGLVGDRRLQRFEVVVRHVSNAFDLRPEAIGVLDCPPTVTVNRVRPWKLLSAEIISNFCDP